MVLVRMSKTSFELHEDDSTQIVAHVTDCGALLAPRATLAQHLGASTRLSDSRKHTFYFLCPCGILTKPGPQAESLVCVSLAIKLIGIYRIV